jgi:hypothetical protein
MAATSRSRAPPASRQSAPRDALNGGEKLAFAPRAAHRGEADLAGSSVGDAMARGAAMRLVIGLLTFAGLVGLGLVLLLQTTGLFPGDVWQT